MTPLLTRNRLPFERILTLLCARWVVMYNGARDVVRHNVYREKISTFPVINLRVSG